MLFQLGCPPCPGSRLGWVGGTPSQIRMGGTLPRSGWGGGYPSQVRTGVPYPVLMGGGGCYPIPGQDEGYPHPVRKNGVPPHWPDGLCHLGPGWGNPPPPYLGPGWGTPSHLELGPGWGTPPPCEQRHRLLSKHYLPSYFVHGR